MEENGKSQIVGVLIGEYRRNRFYPKVERSVQRWLIDAGHEALKEAALQVEWDEMEVPEYNPQRSYEAVMQKLAAMGSVVARPSVCNDTSSERDDASRFIRPTKPAAKRILMRVAAVAVPILVLGTVALMRWMSPDVPMIRYSVPWGERGELQLPDGSRMWVNAGSMVAFPEKFGRARREISLEGEAYFDVKGDVRRPFVVTADRLSVEVTGTEFNIRAFPGQECLSVTVADGTVEVTTPDRQVFALEPDCQLAYHASTGESLVSEVDAPTLAAWRTGELVFDGETFGDMMEHLQMHYGIPFRIEEPMPISGRYTIRFDQGTPIENVLEILTSLVGVFAYDVSAQEVRIYAR